MAKLLAMIKRHEGFRRFPYKDTLGVLTIGYGFNLDSWMAYGISIEEANALLETKIEQAELEADLLPGWDDCNDARRAVLIDMVYNMGLKGIRGFRKMLSAVEARDYQTAAAEMLDSKWARQVQTRATELADMMRSGAW